MRQPRPAAPAGTAPVLRAAPHSEPGGAVWDALPESWYRPGDGATTVPRHTVPQPRRELPLSQHEAPRPERALVHPRHAAPGQPHPGAHPTVSPPVGPVAGDWRLPARAEPRAGGTDGPDRSRTGPATRSPAQWAPARPQRQRHPWGTIISLTVGLMLAVYGLVQFGYEHPGDFVLPTPTGTVAAFPVSTQSAHYIGMATRYPLQLRMPAFAQDVLGSNRRPQIVEYFQGFSPQYPFNSAYAWYFTKQKILPLIQINPWHVQLARVVKGDYDHYVETYAAAVARFNAPVAISFGHEMNGWWYPWGRQRDPNGSPTRGTSPATFVAAWQHIHDVFARAGASNVKWVWTISRDARRPGWPPVKDWWPGSKYVTWIGMDGYFRRPTVTFHWLFAKQLTAIRAFTNKPVLIAETAVRPTTPTGQPNPFYAQQIQDLFYGVRHTPHLLGFVWFDLRSKQTGINWNIDQNKTAITTFRNELNRGPVSASPSARPPAAQG